MPDWVILMLQNWNSEIGPNEAFVVAESVSDVSKRRKIELRIYLCMMAPNASGEQSFSKLGRIKGALRSSVGQERLSMLTLMSMEHELLRSLDFTDTIEEFALAKSQIPLR